MPVSQTNTTPKRGRPPTASNRNVWEDLLAASERLLADKSPYDLTQRELALSAGTTDAMIQYYFGSKESLLLELLERAVEEIVRGLIKLESEILTVEGNPTRHLVSTVNDLYYAHIASTRIWAAEHGRFDSKIRDAYVTRNATKTSQRICRIMKLLIKQGTYDKNVNLDLASFTMTSLILSPIWSAAVLPSRGLSNDKFTSEEWIDHVTSIMDGLLRPQRL